MANAYKLTFISDTNNQITMNINHPSTYLTDGEVKAAMEKMIESDALIFADGKLKTPDKAELVTVTETKIQL